MRFFSWFTRTHQPTPAYYPDIEVLEDRTVPVLLRTLFPITFVPPATHLQVIAPQDVVSGQTFNVVVQALDATNHVATGFRGTVQISLGTADPGATFPSTFTFSAADRGRYTIQVKLTAIGDQTVKAISGALTGQAALTVDAPATHFTVSAIGRVTVGSPTLVNVAALDANNQIAPGYTGTVHFTCTDGIAALPANYTFTQADGGAHLFSATFGTTGNITIAVTDVAQHSVTGGTSILVHSLPFYYGFGSFYPYGYYNPYPMMSVVTYPPASTPATTGTTTGIADPISNISYGANLFGRGLVTFSSTDPIANISYGLNPLGTGPIRNIFSNRIL